MNSNMKSHFNTDGRTDGLTEKLDAAVDQVTAVDARARSNGSNVCGWSA